MAEQLQLSGVRLGPLLAGERITLTDPKGRRHSVVLTAGGQFHTEKGAVSHDDLISRPEGIVVGTTGGTQFLAMRPLLNEFTVSMPRGAAVVYPKDAAPILMGADIFPGARVLEAGAGSGALTCSLLRAIGPGGRLISYERREDFAAIARRNVENFLGASPPHWDLRVADVPESLSAEPLDRVVLDMLSPWECVAALAELLVPGGVFCAYVATTTQLAETVETLRVHSGFTEPVVAGSFANFTLTYTAGYFGIDDTGSVKICTRFATDMGRLQFTAPEQPNYVSIVASNGATLEYRYDVKGNVRPWDKTLYIKVVKGFFREGDQLIVHFGDPSGGCPGVRMQTFCEETFEFKVLVDAIATCTYLEVPNSPVLRIVPGPAAVWKACSRLCAASVSLSGSYSKPKTAGAIPRTRCRRTSDYHLRSLWLACPRRSRCHRTVAGPNGSTILA
jgi:tRNA (adenine57-N1/adenine58-N1)-methyltransferase